MSYRLLTGGAIRLSTICLLPLLIGACDDALQPTAPAQPTPPGERPDAEQSAEPTTRIYLGAAEAAVQGAVAAASVAARSGGPAVAFSQIESLQVTIQGIDAKRKGGDWVSFDFEHLVVDLADLSSDELVVAASSELPPGDYSNVRFQLSGATIVFSGDVTLAGHTFVAGEAYQLEIPDSHRGLKVSTVHFTVGEEGGEVLIYFEPSESTASIALKRGGKLLMRLLLYEADEHTEEAATKKHKQKHPPGTRGRGPSSGDTDGSDEAGETPAPGTAAVWIGRAGDEAGLPVLGPPRLPVEVEDVASLRVMVTGVEVYRPGEDGGPEVEEIPIEPTEVDFFALCAGQSLLLTRSDLPPGDYRAVRLLLEGGSIAFHEQVTVGDHVFEPETDYGLSLPEDRGLLVRTDHFAPASETEETLALLFDADHVLGSLRPDDGGFRVQLDLFEAAEEAEAAIAEGATDGSTKCPEEEEGEGIPTEEPPVETTPAAG